MTTQKSAERVWSCPKIVAAIAVGSALLGTAIAVGQRADQAAPATQPETVHQPGSPHVLAPVGSMTQPAERAEWLRRRAAAREMNRTGPDGNRSGMATPQTMPASAAPSVRANGSSDLPALAQAGNPSGPRLDGQRMQAPDDAELERRAAAARASALRQRRSSTSRPAGSPPATGSNVAGPYHPGGIQPGPGGAMPRPGVNPPGTPPGNVDVNAPINRAGVNGQPNQIHPGQPIQPNPQAGVVQPAVQPGVVQPGAVQPGVNQPAGNQPSVTYGNGQPAVQSPTSAGQLNVSMNPSTGQPQFNLKDMWRLSKDERPYVITWDNTPLDKVLKDIEQMSGESFLSGAVLDPATKAKTITFSSNGILNFDDMLTKVDQILFGMMPGYWIVSRDNYLMLDQLTEWYRKIPPSRMYSSVESYRKDKLPKWEVASLMYEPKYRQANDLANLAVDIVPVNGARASLVEGSGRIALKGFVYFIDQQIAVLEKEDVPANQTDGRVIKTYELKYTTTADASRLLQALLPNSSGDNGGNPNMPRPPRPQVPGAPPVAEGVGGRSTFSNVDIQENTRLNQLTITANEQKHKLVSEYLEKYIDLPMKPTEKGELIKIEHADPSELIEIIRPLLGERQMQMVPVQPRPGQPQPPPPQPGQPQPMMNQLTSNSTAVMIAVPSSKSILVKASKDEMKFIKEYVTMLDVETPYAKVQYIPLKFGQGNSIANILNSSMGQRQAGRMTPGQQTFHAAADMQNDRGVVISGEPKDITDAKELINKLDVDPDEGASEHLVQLEHASPTALSELLSNRYGSGGGGRRYSGGGGGSSSLPRFIGDETSHTLVVVSTKDMWPDIERVIKEVDEKSVIKGTAKAYTLKHSQAMTVAQILGQSFGPRNRRGFSEESSPTFFADPQSNKILVTATDDIHEQVTKLLTELDQPSPTEGTLQAIELAHADATYVASKIEDLFQTSGSGRFSPQGSAKPAVNVVAEPVSNRVLVTSSEEDFKKAKDLAMNIDQQFAARQIVRKTFRPQHTSSFKIERALSALFPDASASGGGSFRFRGNSGDESPTAVKIVDTGDSIMASAPKDKMAEIERVFTELDTDPAKDNEVRTYTIKGVDYEGTEPIADQLTQIFGGGSGGGSRNRFNFGGGGEESAPSGIKIIGQRGSNLLFVSAPPARMKEIDTRIQEIIKSQGANDMTFSIKQFPITKGTPEDVVAVVSPLLMAKFEEIQSQSRRWGSPEPKIMPQRASHMVTVAAPESIMPLAKELIEKFDQPTTPATMKIVTMKTAKAKEVAPVIEENVRKQQAESSSSSRFRFFSGFGMSSGSGNQNKSPDDLQVSAVEASNQLILRGPEDLVDKAEKLAMSIDKDANPDGRIIQIFDVPPGVDSYDLISLIDEMVGGGSSSDDIFGSTSKSKSSSSGAITVKPTMNNKLIVSTPMEKLPAITRLIETQAQLAKAVAESGQKPEGDKGHILGSSGRGEITVAYDIPKGPVDEIAKTLDRTLVDLWGYFDAPYVKPFPFAKQVVVTGKPQQFKLVKEYLDKIVETPPSVPMAVMLKKVTPGMAERIITGLQVTPGATPINVQPMPQTRKQSKSAMDMMTRQEIQFDTPITTQPAGQSDASGSGAVIQHTSAPFVAPSAMVNELSEAVASLSIAQVSTQPAPAVAAHPSSAPAAQEQAETSEKPANPLAAAVAQALAGGKVEVRYDEEKGEIYFIGSVSELQALQKSVDTLIEDANKLANIGDEQPIRVFRLNNIDVTIAASILETMFNDKQPTQQAQQPGRPGQPAPAPAPAAQQNKNSSKDNESSSSSSKDDKNSSSRRRRADKEEEDKSDEESGAKKKLAAGERIRVIPNTRDQTLIIRANRDDFPLIAELILKIDRPTDRPPTDFRVFPIKKLNAVDVEEVLKSVLKIEDTRSMRGGYGGGYDGSFGGGFNPGFGSSRYGNMAAQSQMMEQLQAQMLEMQTAGMTGAEGEGKLKLNPAKEITITSDPPTNSVIVMAPQEGMKLVERLINELEKQDSPVQTVTIPIKNAEAEKVATELEHIFGSATATSGGSSRGSTRSTGSSRRSSMSSGFSGFGGTFGGGFGNGGFQSATARMGQELRITANTRTNTLIVRALSSDIEQIEKIVKLIDVPMVEQVHLYPVEHGNATTIADTLAKIFVTDDKAEGPQATRITADSDTNTVLVWAPKAQQMMIEVKIKELETRAEQKGTPREILLSVASATAVAEKLREIFVQKGAIKGGQRVSIEGDDNSGKLFVTAPKEIFDDISTIARSLDKGSREDVRVFPLKNAYASDVYQMFTTLVTQQLGLLKGKGNENIPSVVPDLRNNALIVQGTPVVFLAVEKILAQIDVPPGDKSTQTTAMFGLTKGRATDIAASINALYAGKKFENGVQPPTAVGEPSSNVVYVYGTKVQIDQIKTSVIDPLEKFEPAIDTVVKDYQLKVQFAKVEEIADTLNKYFVQKAATLGAAGYASLPPADRAVTIIPDPSTRQLYITSSEKNRKLIEELLKSADVKDITDTARTQRVFPLQYAVPASAAQAISTTFGKTGNVSEIEKVNVVAEGGTNSLVVSASADNMKKIEAMVLELDKPGTSARNTFTIDIKQADANDVAMTMNDIYTNTRDKTASGRAAALFTVPPGTNQLLVTTTEAELPKIKTTVAQLDTPGARMSPRIVAVKNGSAALMATTLTRMFTDQANKAGKTPPLIIAEDSTNSLIVKAGEADFAQITELAGKLDIPAQTGSIDVIPINRGQDVKTFAAMIERIVNEGAASVAAQTGIRAGRVAIGVDETLPALIVSGSPELFKSVKDTMARLDQNAPVSNADVTTVVIPGGNGLQGAELQRLLRQFVNQNKKRTNVVAPAAAK